MTFMALSVTKGDMLIVKKSVELYGGHPFPLAFRLKVSKDCDGNYDT